MADRSQDFQLGSCLSFEIYSLIMAFWNIWGAPPKISVEGPRRPRQAGAARCHVSVVGRCYQPDVPAREGAVLDPRLRVHPTIAGAPSIWVVKIMVPFNFLGP